MSNTATADNVAYAKATATHLSTLAASTVAAKMAAVNAAREQAAASATQRASALDQLKALAASAGLDLSALFATAATPATPAATRQPNPVAVAPANPAAYHGGNVPLNARIEAIAPNPKKPGSAAHMRYALYPRAGATVLDAVKAGVSRADILYDIRKGYIRLTSA